MLARSRMKGKRPLGYTGGMTDLSLRRFAPGDMHWLVARHQDLYAREAGFDSRFGAVVAEVLHGFCTDHDPRCERGWLAEQEGRRLGSIFCMRDDAQTARLRLFLVVPEARSQGLGKQLLASCMGFARGAGYAGMVLKTYQSHDAAGALYRAFGWQLQEVRPVRGYGQNLEEQTWRICFQARSEEGMA